MEWHVKSVTVAGVFTLRVSFVDGHQGLVCFEPEFFRGVFEHLIRPDRFAEVYVDQGAVTWPGGLDLAPDNMYDRIVRGNGIISMAKAA